jgi:hypothetical protein
MDFMDKYPEYTAVRQHIRRANIERVAGIADGIAQFVVDCWNAIQQPPAPAAVIIDRRREHRGDSARLVQRFAHR